MTKYFHHSVLIALSVSAAALVPACGNNNSSGDDDSAGKGGSGGTTSTGGSSGSGGSGNPAANCGPNDNVVVVPSNTGWVDKTDLCMSTANLGIQGAWYPYGDQYGNGNGAKKCLTYGNHMPSECAQITGPDPTVMAFPNVNGEMITTGTSEPVLPCVAGSMAATIPTSGCPGMGAAGGNDYSSMWGAGIGWDLNADKGPPDGTGAKSTWNPDTYGVIGVRFTIVNAPPVLRVEFPMQLLPAEAAADTPPITTMPPTTDDHSAGAPYYGAKPDGKYGNSPVTEGVNTITWDQIGVPKAGIYPFDRTRILGIQWHVPTSPGSSTMYNFTIKDVTFLRHL
jgi:hypothetical protein